MFKTHVDAFDKWDASIAAQLQQLAKQHCKPALSDLECCIVKATHARKVPVKCINGSLGLAKQCVPLCCSKGLIETM